MLTRTRTSTGVDRLCCGGLQGLQERSHFLGGGGICGDGRLPAWDNACFAGVKLLVMQLARATQHVWRTITNGSKAERVELHVHVLQVVRTLVFVHRQKSTEHIIPILNQIRKSSPPHTLAFNFNPRHSTHLLYSIPSVHLQTLVAFFATTGHG